MDERIQKAIEDYEIKENIGYKWLLNDRLMMINISFDQGDKSRIKSALMTTFDMLTPYINNRFKKCRCNKKIADLDNIHDKDAFIQEAHIVYRMLLQVMYDHDMLLTEVPVALG